MFKPLFISIAYLALTFCTKVIWGNAGFLGEEFIANLSTWEIIGYAAIVSHITITCMSLSFHRFHTHKGIIINQTLDLFMQTWLWFVTSMSKSDWVSVHIYHHAHSDKPRDPHSPVQKGFWRVFFGGAMDYGIASKKPEVRKFRVTIKENKIERFFDQNEVLGPILLSTLMILLLGPFWGTVFSLINCLVSPLLAVGGVNAIAHFIGYRNHFSGDNSKNIGFLFPLNFIICGELDHNNHHKYPKSCSFRHKWYEFDIGYVYIKALEFFKLVEVKNVYNTKKFKEELSLQVQKILEYDFKFSKKCEELAKNLDLSMDELKERIIAYVEGRKTEFDESTKIFIKEIKRAAKINLRLNLSFT